MALETSNLRAIRNFTAVGWDTSPALCGCSLLRTSPRNSSTAWTNMREEMEGERLGVGVQGEICADGEKMRGGETSKITKLGTGIGTRQRDNKDDN